MIYDGFYINSHETLGEGEEDSAAFLHDLGTEAKGPRPRSDAKDGSLQMKFVTNSSTRKHSEAPEASGFTALGVRVGAENNFVDRAETILERLKFGIKFVIIFVGSSKGKSQVRKLAYWLVIHPPSTCVMNLYVLMLLPAAPRAQRYD